MEYTHGAVELTSTASPHVNTSIVAIEAPQWFLLHGDLEGRRCGVMRACVIVFIAQFTNEKICSWLGYAEAAILKRWVEAHPLKNKGLGHELRP